MNRPEDIQRRIGNIREIETIVSTLHALATAHQIEVRAHLDAIRAQEATVARALSAALSLVATDIPEPEKAPGLTIVVGAAQGFSGAFGDRMADAALSDADRGAELFVIGARTLSAIEERGITPLWSADMAPHALEIPALANRLADILFERLAKTARSPVAILFADPAAAEQPPAHRTLFPFEFGRFPRSQLPAPLITLQPAVLIAALVEEYVFAELCEALMLGFAAENGARAAAMARAQSNVKRIAADLKAEYQVARQEQMTTEIIELSSASAQNRR